jgi:hypothetical protein
MKYAFRTARRKKLGNRCITRRHLHRYGYSQLRVFRCLHEKDFEPHHMRPYGLGAGKFSSLQMFQQSRSRSTAGLRERRGPKKTTRQQAHRSLREAFRDDSAR